MHDRIFHIQCAPCTAGETLLLISPAGYCGKAHIFLQGMLPYLPVGTQLFADTALFSVEGSLWFPGSNRTEHAQRALLLQALQDCPEQKIKLHARRTGYALAGIILSDKGAAGLRTDACWPEIHSLVQKSLPLCAAHSFLLPDDPVQLKSLLTALALEHGYDLIISSGGTGLSPRDTSPEATAAVLDRRLHGFEQAMMQASLAQTPMAMISRAVAGTLGSALIVNLPGSVRAVRCNLETILPALEHALDKLHGDSRDCGQP